MAMLMLCEQQLPISESWLQYGAFGLLSILLLGGMFYYTPKIVKAVESIAPTIADQIKSQDEKHREERKQLIELLREAWKTEAPKQ